MNPGDAFVGIDHPELANAVAGVKARLSPAVMCQARGGNLDEQQYVFSARLCKRFGGNVVDRLGDYRNVPTRPECRA